MRLCCEFCRSFCGPLLVPTDGLLVGLPGNLFAMRTPLEGANVLFGRALDGSGIAGQDPVFLNVNPALGWAAGGVTAALRERDSLF